MTTAQRRDVRIGVVAGTGLTCREAAQRIDADSRTRPALYRCLRAALGVRSIGRSARMKVFWVYFSRFANVTRGVPLDLLRSPYPGCSVPGVSTRRARIIDSECRLCWSDVGWAASRAPRREGYVRGIRESRRERQYDVAQARARAGKLKRPTRRSDQIVPGTRIERRARPR